MTKPHPSNPKVALSLRLYRALSRAFPFEFKSAHAPVVFRYRSTASYN